MIEVVQGDIANLRASAIVRPVSAEWDPVSAAARRIEIAAGPQLLEQCEKLGDLPVGSAVLTVAGEPISTSKAKIVSASACCSGSVPPSSETLATLCGKGATRRSSRLSR